MRTGVLQLNASDDPAGNLDQTVAMANAAADQGAGFIVTPEVTNCVSNSRMHQAGVLRLEDDDPTLAALREVAKSRGVWLLIGSLALLTTDLDGRFANRSFMIAPSGDIVARYDKIHMFDVDISETESYRESAGYRPGDRAVVVDTEFGRVGMSICYDLRFPHLYQALADAGAKILSVPAAFSPVSGAVHWHALLRARAIETGCWVVAPAQTGTHASAQHKTRDTYGHSLIVSPWGKVVLDADAAPGVYMAELDMGQVAKARARIPGRLNKREFSGPV